MPMAATSTGTRKVPRWNRAPAVAGRVACRLRPAIRKPPVARSEDAELGGVGDGVPVHGDEDGGGREEQEGPGAGHPDGAGAGGVGSDGIGTGRSAGSGHGRHRPPIRGPWGTRRTP